MKTRHAFSMTLVSCIFLFNANCQFNSRPFVGQVLHYNVIDQISLADTGGIGTSVLWDYSANTFDPSYSYFDEFRLPTAEETDVNSDINLVKVGGEGPVRMYHVNTDSLVLISGSNNVSEFSYSNYRTILNYPIIEDSVYRDTAISEYYSGPSLITRKNMQHWSVSGTGELRTPTKSYANVLKVSRYSTTEFYVGGNLHTTVEAISIEWYELGNSAILFQINWDDNSDVVSSTFINNQSAASNPDYEWSNFSVYPNPVVTNLNFSEEIETYKLVDAQGKTLISGSGKIIDMSTYPEGVYFLQAFIDGEYRTTKILKK